MQFTRQEIKKHYAHTHIYICFIIRDNATYESLTSKIKCRFLLLFAFTASTPPKDTGVFESFGRFIIALLD